MKQSSYLCVKPGSDRTEGDQEIREQQASRAVLEQKDEKEGGSFKGTEKNGN